MRRAEGRISGYAIKVVVVLVLGGLSIAGASAAYAQNAIKTCINNKSHAVRLIPTTGVCRKTETLDTVGATGPQGPPGPQGSPGMQGPPGTPGSADAWSLTGNSGTTAGTNFLGTTDDQPFEIHADGLRVMRYEPAPVAAVGPNVIGGFPGNSVTDGASSATIGGGGDDGEPNQVTAFFGTIGGGLGNVAGNKATVGGGEENAASANFATVAGGMTNNASAQSAAVCGGQSNTASGPESTVAGGLNNTAAGAHSFAAGTSAQATNDGAFVWADDSSTINFSSSNDNQFLARATGGFGFFTAIDAEGNPTDGCVILANDNGSLFCTGSINGTTINMTSDRALKTGFEPIAGNDVLQRVAALPMSSWTFKGETVRHIGPMAQDFHAAFKVGADDKHISVVDEGGVALAAIQGLYRMMQVKDDQLAEQARQIKTLEAEKEAELRQTASLTVRLEKLERVTEAGRDAATMRPTSSRQAPPRSSISPF